MNDSSHRRGPQTAAAVAFQVIKGPEGQLIGSETRHYMRVTSTMDVARQLVSEGAREGTVILADEQTQGRGRLGRHWVSRPDDSLSLSVILYPTVRQLPQLNMVASLATVRAITGITGLKPLIKWPNDILLSGRKVCGILIENIFDGPALKAAVIGIGMNVNLDPSYFPEIAATATSLSIEAGRDLSLQDLTARLLQEMDQLYGDLLRTGTVHDSWIPFVETVGKQVRIRSGDHIEEGRVESVDAKGSLILRRPDGSRAALDAGEVTLQI